MPGTYNPLGLALAPGTCVGPYEIVGLLGVGGMGEVYRARDTKLHRDVALKTLRSVEEGDTGRRARFVREAQALASLNHPNIGQIHGLEEDASGVQVLVLELVEGVTLAERIAQHTIGLSEAVSIARHIARGIDAAHERGIIHRDLKPSNVKITPDGTVKLLDFGLAKSSDGSIALPNVTTLTAEPATMAGTILGTWPYMSPEQAQGLPVDRRTDLWSLGVTNRDFKTFVDAGGYTTRAYWTEPFVDGDRTVSWENAMRRFVDPTGRPGPATWEGGAYKDGEANDPVAGVSWYEAAAYAAFAGRSLPTVYHWFRAANTDDSRFLVALSNFSGKGATAVGRSNAIGSFGAADMAGNVREWCWNASGPQRYLLGGSWADPAYMLTRGQLAPPSIARSPTDSAVPSIRAVHCLRP